MISRSFFLIFIALCALTACLEDLELPPEPKIEFLSLSATNITQFSTLILTISFEDGDGDIGYGSGITRDCSDNVCDFESDSSCYLNPFWNAILIDMRDSCYVSPYIFPDIQQGNNTAVFGEIDISIPPIFCKNFGCQTCETDTLVYQVILKDRAQNMSNPVFTDTIIINCL